jgi:hypothetical protein
MTADVIKAHLAAIEGQLELTKVQVLALRHALEPMFAPKVAVSVPERCEDIPESRCGLQAEDARISRRTFDKPNAWQCLGCRVQVDSA